MSGYDIMWYERIEQNRTEQRMRACPANVVTLLLPLLLQLCSLYSPPLLPHHVCAFKTVLARPHVVPEQRGWNKLQDYSFGFPTKMCV